MGIEWCKIYPFGPGEDVRGAGNVDLSMYMRGRAGAVRGNGCSIIGALGGGCSREGNPLFPFREDWGVEPWRVLCRAGSRG